jgi:hypothetical protein
MDPKLRSGACARATWIFVGRPRGKVRSISYANQARDFLFLSCLAEGVTVDLLFPDQGLVYQLQQILTPTVHYHLYTAPTTLPTLSWLVATLTEAAFTGYAAISQAWANFILNGVQAHSGFAIASPITFTNSSGSPVNVYGYYVTDSTDTILLAIAQFDNAPIAIPAGQTLTVIPVWGDFSQLAV